MNEGNKMENEYFSSSFFVPLSLRLKSFIHNRKCAHCAAAAFAATKMTISCIAKLSLNVTNVIKDDYRADAGKIWCTFEGDQRSRRNGLCKRKRI